MIDHDEATKTALQYDLLYGFQTPATLNLARAYLALKAENAKLKPPVDEYVNSASKIAHRNIDRRITAEAEVKRLREALQWYANADSQKGRFVESTGIGTFWKTEYDLDFGQRAREALNPPATFAETRGDMGQ